MERKCFEYARVYSYEIESVWPHAKELIEKALNIQENLEHSIEEIEKSLYEKKMQLWVAYYTPVTVGTGIIAAAGITTVKSYANAEHCILLYLGGADGLWFDWGAMLHSMRDWAKDVAKCDHFLIYGRKGWERTVKSLGFKHYYTALIMDLNDENLH